MLGGGMLTREGMLDGTAPLLDRLPQYANLPPEERRFRNDEAILALLTNVEDFGRIRFRRRRWPWRRLGAGAALPFPKASGPLQGERRFQSSCPSQTPFRQQACPALVAKGRRSPRRRHRRRPCRGVCREGSGRGRRRRRLSRLSHRLNHIAAQR
jgi:hypothetical protein